LTLEGRGDDGRFEAVRIPIAGAPVPNVA